MRKLYHLAVDGIPKTDQLFLHYWDTMQKDILLYHLGKEKMLSMSAFSLAQTRRFLRCWKKYFYIAIEIGIATRVQLPHAPATTIPHHNFRYVCPSHILLKLSMGEFLFHICIPGKVAPHHISIFMDEDLSIARFLFLNSRPF